MIGAGAWGTALRDPGGARGEQRGAVGARSGPRGGAGGDTREPAAAGGEAAGGGDGDLSASPLEGEGRGGGSDHGQSVIVPPPQPSPSRGEAHGYADTSSTRDAILLAVPMQHLRGVLGRLPQSAIPLVVCAKGVEAGTHRLPLELVAELLPLRLPSC